MERFVCPRTAVSDLPRQVKSPESTEALFQYVAGWNRAKAEATGVLQAKTAKGEPTMQAQSAGASSGAMDLTIPIQQTSGTSPHDSVHLGNNHHQR
jgi:hypothetical protein